MADARRAGGNRGRGRGVPAGDVARVLGAGPAAEGEPEVQGINLIAEFEGDGDLQTAVARIRANIGELSVVTQYEGEFSTGDYVVDDMKYTLLESINGDRNMEQHTIRVDFLKSDQKMMLPYALGMNPAADFTGGRELPYDALIGLRYYKVGTLNYVNIRRYMTHGVPYATIAAEVDAIALTPEGSAGVVTAWDADAYYTYADGLVDSEATADVAFHYLSIALSFNCDIRDTGALVYSSGRCADNLWMSFQDYDADRLQLQLHPFSMISIAAMNYGPTGNSAIGGWIRAFGVSTCILPEPLSKCNKEYRYTKSQTTFEQRSLVGEFRALHEDNLQSLCMNIIAMFGLLHLNKDHTYRPTEVNMERICDSYIDTLRTLVDSANTDFLKQSKEVICRTAPHPFGLAQPYFLAKLMWKCGYLSAPLMIRHNVAPPPIQRFMIVSSVVHSWTTLPAGAKLSVAFAEAIGVVDEEVARIRACPPAYSGLHQYYGIHEMATPVEASWRAVESLIPCVYGYAMTLHGQEKEKKEGVALAMSFKNVERDNKATAMMFATLWEKYLDTTETEGLVTFAVNSVKLARAGEPAPAAGM